MIYLASPYSHENPFVRMARAKASGCVVAHEAKKGRFLFGTVAHGHYCEQVYGEVLPWQTWMVYSYDAISTCKKLLVLQLPGWEKSKGVEAEIEYARARDIPVEYLSWEDIQPMLNSRLILELEKANG